MNENYWHMFSTIAKKKYTRKRLKKVTTDIF
jgi:hypothetical protein